MKNKETLAERTALLYTHGLSLIRTGMLGALVTFIFLYSYGSSHALYLWFGSVMVVSLWRIHLIRNYYKVGPLPEDRYSWCIKYTQWSAVSKTTF